MTAALATSAGTDVARLWPRYVPSPALPWNLQRVVHLHRRAAFAAPWHVLQRDLRDGPEASLERILTGSVRSEAESRGFESTAALIGNAAAQSNHPGRLQAWWLLRMLYSADPLGEKLTLLWHNHFATSNRKLENLLRMKRQNELFRQHARGPFAELLAAVVCDPAMLLWLDAPANHKGHPNENLARELLELFTLGIGHYTETDIKETARALTGWTVIDDEFHRQTGQHDDGNKTVLGQTGPWTGDDIFRIIVEHLATSRRLAGRLCDEFVGEGIATPEHVDSLAAGLRQHDLRIGWAVETILRSELFFSADNIRSRVAAPAEFLIGAIRALELDQPPPQTLLLADWMRRCGQELFYPPNVGGWHGGRDWLRTDTLITRASFAAQLVEGQCLAGPPDWSAFAARHWLSDAADTIVPFLTDLLFGGEPSAGWTERILESLAAESVASEAVLLRAVAAALASPEAQIG